MGRGVASPLIDEETVDLTGQAIEKGLTSFGDSESPLQPTTGHPVCTRVRTRVRSGSWFGSWLVLSWLQVGVLYPLPSGPTVRRIPKPTVFLFITC